MLSLWPRRCKRDADVCDDLPVCLLAEDVCELCFFGSLECCTADLPFVDGFYVMSKPAKAQEQSTRPTRVSPSVGRSGRPKAFQGESRSSRVLHRPSPSAHLHFCTLAIEVSNTDNRLDGHYRSLSSFIPSHSYTNTHFRQNLFFRVRLKQIFKHRSTRPPTVTYRQVDPICRLASK